MGETRICWSKASVDQTPEISEEGAGVTCPAIWPVSNNLGEFNIEVTDLDPLTTYYYQAYVKNNEGLDNHGEPQSFTTLEFCFLPKKQN